MNKLNHLERFNENWIAGDQPELVIHDYIKKNLKIEIREEAAGRQAGGGPWKERSVYLDLILKDEVLSTQQIPVFRDEDVPPSWPSPPPSSWA